MSEHVLHVIEQSLVLPDEFDVWEYVTEHGPDLFRMAREARSLASSYKGFNVGCVAVATSIDGGVAEFEAGNRNLEPGPNASKMCAERFAILFAYKAGYDRTQALFTSGPNQPDTQSGITSHTLHNCGECRDAFVGGDVDDEIEQFDEELTNSEIIASSMHAGTLSFTIDPVKPIYELHTISEVVAKHQRPERVQSTYYEDPGFKRWKSNISYFRELAQTSINDVKELLREDDMGIEARDRILPI